MSSREKKCCRVKPLAPNGKRVVFAFPTLSIFETGHIDCWLAFIPLHAMNGGLLVRIIAFSDFHGSSIAVDKAARVAARETADLMLIAGDLAFHSVDSAFSILQKLSSSTMPILYVPGNMDSAELASFKHSDMLRCIHGRCERIGDFSFLGVGGAVKGPFMTPFESTEEEIQETLKKAIENCENTDLVLVSHAPPKNTSLDLTRSGMHVGSSAIRNFIESKQPILVVCGHIHEARGTDRIGRTVILNPGPAQNWFYSLVELTDNVDVRLLEFV
jgi:putative phosphoesterase